MNPIPLSTELDDETGHNCKMSKDQYQAFTQLFLGLDNNTWANQCTECVFCNLILQDLNAILYYFDTDWQVCGKPMSPPDEITDIAIIPAWITLLLVNADACNPRIINNVWGQNEAARIALGGP